MFEVRVPPAEFRKRTLRESSDGNIEFANLRIFFFRRVRLRNSAGGTRTSNTAYSKSNG
ncbi:MAG: hypothetical protein AAFY16_08215 [Cyanobacteria bacterium J06642_3]